jgi:nicotinate-nucleotide adenylyltransferase
MHHYITVPAVPAKLGILAGAFNPPTCAHLAMAEAALGVVDEVLFVLPRVFPHKEYSGATLDARVEMLRAALDGHPRFSLATTDAGLFIDIARDAREHYGNEVELYFLCGRDAAERIVNWDYGAGEGIREQLEMFSLLVASRGGVYEPPSEIRHRVRSIALPDGLDEVSSSEVRRRIRSGEAWQDLAPEAVVRVIAERNLF